MERFNLSMTLFRGALLGIIWLLFLPNVYAQIVFGSTRIDSSIGQPLNATIDVEVSPQDFQTLRGRSYRKRTDGSIDNTLTTRIFQGSRGAIVRLGSLKPINDPFINVVVDLITDSGFSVSSPFTFLIDPPTKQPLNQTESQTQEISKPHYQYTTPPRSLVNRSIVQPSGQVNPRLTAQSQSSNRPIKKKKVRRKQSTKHTKSQLEGNQKNEIKKIDQKIEAAKKDLQALEAIMLKTQEALQKEFLRNATKVKPSPKTAETAPKITETAPKTTEAAPKIAEAAPKIAEAAPKIAEASPKIAEAAPKITEATPKTAETAPNTEKPTSKKQVVTPQSAVISQEEEGLFGISWLPNPLDWIALIDLQDLFKFEFFSFETFLTPEILWVGSSLLIFFVLVFVFLTWRKRRIALKQSESKHNYDIKNLDISPQNNASTFPSEALDEKEQKVEMTTPKSVEEKKTRKKKKSFLNKLTPPPKTKEDKAGSEEVPAVDFSELDSHKKQNPSTSKIERFVDDTSMTDKDDFLKELEHTVVGIHASDDIMENDEYPTMLPSSPSESSYKTDEVIFSDEITRIAQPSEEQSDPVSTAMLEMFSKEEPSIAPPPTVTVSPTPEPQEPQITNEVSPITTELSDTSSSDESLDNEVSIDDLDFSAEKTMVMPSLKDVVHATDEESTSTNTLDFRLDFDSTSPSTSQPKDDPTKTEGDPAVEESIDSPLAFDIPDSTTPASTPDTSANDQSTPSPEAPLELPALSAPPDPQTTKDDTDPKNSSEKTSKPPVMIDLAALDLSSLKLD